MNNEIEVSLQEIVDSFSIPDLSKHSNVVEKFNSLALSLEDNKEIKVKFNLVSKDFMSKVNKHFHLIEWGSSYDFTIQMIRFSYLLLQLQFEKDLSFNPKKPEEYIGLFNESAFNYHAFTFYSSVFSWKDKFESILIILNDIKEKREKGDFKKKKEIRKELFELKSSLESKCKKLFKSLAWKTATKYRNGFIHGIAPCVLHGHIIKHKDGNSEGFRLTAGNKVLPIDIIKNSDEVLSLIKHFTGEISEEFRSKNKSN